MFRIVVFASGTGSNAMNLIKHFNSGNHAKVVLLASNKSDAPVLKKAEEHHVETYVFGKKDFYESENVIQKIQDCKPDLIVLAGFLWLVPQSFIKAFPDLIINLHPSLLPKYGGKGMYGQNVHNAVLSAKEQYTGITIHMVNEDYDKGAVIYQNQFDIEANDDLSSIQNKIHQLEQRGLPLAIEGLMKKRGYEVQNHSNLDHL
jgi:phosphoribosylglycinamide formyltransferase 1